MNIYLVPYNWTRHVVVAVTAAAGALLVWWAFLHVRIWAGPTLWAWGILYSRGAEGPLFLGIASGTIAFSSLIVEHSLRRSGLFLRAGLSILGAFVTFLWTVVTFLILALMMRLLATSEMKEIVADPGLASHRHHVWMWLSAGFGSGLGPLLMRLIAGSFVARAQALAANAAAAAAKGAAGMKDPSALAAGVAAPVGPTPRVGWFAHLVGGIAAGGAAAAVWQYLGYHWFGDLYLASFFSLFIWGLLHGLLVWGVPDELYAGWVRVLTPYRYGYRIPVDRVEGGPSERFIGHFPRGLDLFLPVEQGVAELHTSFVRNSQGEYMVRGLSQQPTLVKRPLERVDIRYDPSRPAPLETDLRSEDIVIMNNGKDEAQVEFVMLPKEER